MKMPQVKIFIVGAVLGAVFGATVLGAIAHLLLIGAVVAAVGAVLYRSRRLLLGRARDAKHLKA